MFSRLSPSVCPAQRAARHRLPSRESYDFSHLRRYDAIRRLPPYPSRVAAFVARFPIPVPASTRACVGPSRAHVSGAKPPDHAWACGRPVSYVRVLWSRRESGSPTFPSSLFCMPAPLADPGGCPRHAPSRAQDCCLWVRAHRRLSPPYLLRDILLPTTLHISGLHHVACILTPSSFVLPLLG